MARIWSAGFELNSLTDGVEFDLHSGFTISNTIKRSGYYSGRVSSLSSGNAQDVFHALDDGTGINVTFSRFYLQITTSPSAENMIFLLNDSVSNLSTPLVYVTLDSTGALRLYDEDGVIGSASSVLSTNTWYRIEVKLDKSAAAGSHIVEGKVDGTVFATASNRNISFGASSIAVGGNLNGEAQTQGDWYFDDIAINSNSGAAQTSYPGDGKIVHLHPNSAGDQTNFTATGAATNWQCVNEITPDDVTTYVTNTADVQIDTYNLDNPKLFIGATPTITLVHVGMRFTTNNGGAALNFTPRILKVTGGTVLEGTAASTASITWLTNAAAAPFNYPLTAYTDPDGATWTRSTLYTTLIGVKLGKVGAVVARVSTLWLLVEYTTEESIGINTNVLRPRAFAPGLAR